MKLASESKTINEILSRNMFYEVPRNQRKYVWEETQLSELYDDIFENNDGQYHFMGCLVLEQSSKKDEDKYKIIDGQQRLTTFNILILIISRLFYECQDDKRANSNKKYIIGDIDGDDINKIIVEDSYLTELITCTFDQKTIEKTIESLKYSGIKCDKYNKRILASYMYFYKKISSDLQDCSSTEKIKKLVDMKNKLMNVNIIEIKVPYDDNATMGYKIFEVLNARGIPLEQHELIKNYIFKYIRMKKNTKTDKPKRQWEMIVDNLVSESTDNMGNFFSHYIIHKFGLKPSQKGEFEIIKTKCSKDEVYTLLEDLVKKSEYYKMICDPKEYEKSSLYSEKIMIALTFFKDMNIRQVRPLIMSLFSCFELGKISFEMLEDMIVYLESFYFTYVIVCKNKTNTLENIVLNYAHKIENDFNSEVLENMIQTLKKYKVSYENYSANFKDIGYSKKNKKFRNSANKKTVIYVMNKLEKYYDTDGEQTLNKFSIEHIMCDSGDNDCTSMIGNLLPLSGKRNSKIGDSDFKDKIEYYKKSNILSVREYVKNHGFSTEWTDKDIINRTEKICKLGFDKIWIL